jgi:hypothetical protein
LEVECPVCAAEAEHALAEEAAAVKQRTEAYAKFRAEQERRQEAQRLIRQAGGVAKWYATMSSQDKAKWGDLEAELLGEEKRRAEQVKELAQHLKPFTLDELLNGPGAPKPTAAPDVDLRPKPWPQPPTGILEIDLNDPLAEVPQFSPRSRIVHRDDLTPQPQMRPSDIGMPPDPDFP